MPSKRNQTETPRYYNERLPMIDEILSKTQTGISRENLLRKLNSKIKTPITNDCLSNDIADIKNELYEYSRKKGIEVNLIWKRNTGYYYSIKGFRLFDRSVNEDDKNLLLYANSLFHIFSGTALHHKFSEIVKRLIDDSITIDKKITALPNNIIQIDKGIHVKSKEWLPIILDAILKRQCLELDYAAYQKEVKKKHLSPYVVKQHNNKWYMVAYDHSTSRPQKINVYALDNIRSIDESNKDYFLDEHFSAEDYFKYSIGIWHEHDVAPQKIKLEFSNKDYSQLFESIQNNPIHHLQQCRIDKTGKKMLVELEVYESPELYAIIRSFGSAVKVLEPRQVAEKVKENAKEVANKY